jgi:carbon storage regulator
MLVLTRGIDEGIVIGDNIRITVVRVSGGVVRIGIEAPRDATILRGEHLEAERVLERGEEEP